MKKRWYIMAVKPLPISTAGRLIYKLDQADWGVGEEELTTIGWVGYFHPKSTYPVVFTSSSKEAIIKQMSEFVMDCVEKHEAEYQRLQKARAARKKGKKNGKT